MKNPQKFAILGNSLTNWLYYLTSHLVLPNMRQEKQRRNMSKKSSTHLPITVMVVDDNSHMRSLLKELLKSIGVNEIREAADPVDAFEMMRNTPIDVLLVDLSMPMIDGVEFVKMIRTGEDSPNQFLPIIMVTGHSERKKVEAARDAGVNEFLVKPINAKSLLMRFQSVIDAPRQFIRSGTYFGPDRRRGQADNYDGPWRRKDDNNPAAF